MKIKEILGIIFLIFIVCVFLMIIFLIIRSPTQIIKYDNYCKSKYGEVWKYKTDPFFGKVCVKLNHENVTITNKVFINQTKAREYCEIPPVGSLTKWTHKCN